MNYSNSPRPSAHISISKNRVRHYPSENVSHTRNVYLRDRTEFEIELNNDHNKTVLAKIKMNGEYISQSGIVLRPGERVFLERYLEKDRKFLFETYKVPNTSEAREAIRLNGMVQVEFYEEVVPPTNITWTYTYTNNFPTYDWSNHITCGPDSGGYRSATIADMSSYYLSATTTGGATTRGILTDASSKVDPQSLTTGRVESGGRSNQIFRNVDKQFSYLVFHTEWIQILPEENKSVSDIKIYCSDCGRRFRRAEHFCPTCGKRK